MADLPEPDGDEGEADDKIRKVKVRLADGSVVTQPLPPIEDVIPPQTTTKSARIRWYHALGYTVGEIHHGLNIKYQMVRNIVTTIPKRAAREDMPEVVIQLRETPDIFQAAMDGALEASLLAGRKDRKKQEKEQRDADRLETEEDE